MPLDDQQKSFDRASCSRFCFGSLFLAEDDPHDQMLTMLPQAMMNEGTSCKATGTF
jgi:hypothetical protein